MKKTILLATASAVALLGCASMGPQTAHTPNTDARNPQVYVLSDGAPACADRVMAIVVEPPMLNFPNSGNGNAFPIIWHMRTKGYKFAQNNNLPNPAPIQGPGGVITGCGSGGLTMQCTNKDSAKGSWKYDIKGVIADDGCNPPDLDPVISND
jgi:hypothetical protein